ncbi:hypothetical protein JCM10207_007267 [Rhodosporidiobolus poonsookiae]
MSTHVPPPPPPPLLALHLATPHLASTSTLFPPPPSPPLSEPSSVPKTPTTPASKNDLFDRDWTAVSPHVSSPARSRSSTAESRWSVTSSVSGAGSAGGGAREPAPGAEPVKRKSRKSWMDVDVAPAPAPPAAPVPLVFPALGTGLGAPVQLSAGLEKTPVPLAAHDSEFAWPLTPPSPVFPSSASTASVEPAPVPPSPLPTSLSPASPPRPRLAPRTSTVRSPPRSVPPSPSSPHASTSALPTLPPSAGKSPNPLLDTRHAPRVRMRPQGAYLLGEGRHASVYVAAFLPRRSQEGKGQVRVERRNARAGAAKREEQEEEGEDAEERWELCAAKRLLPDRESQLSGLGEAFILAKLHASPSYSTSTSSTSSTSAAPSAAAEDTDSSALAGSGSSSGARFIVRLHGVRDERDGVDLPDPLPNPPAQGLSRHGSAGSGHSRRWSAGSGLGVGAVGPQSPLRSEFGGAGAEEDNDEEPVTATRTNRLRRPRHSAPLSLASTLSRSHNHDRPVGSAAAPPRPSRLSALEPPLTSSRARARRVSSAAPPPSPPAASPPAAAAAPAPAPDPRISLLLSLHPYGHSLAFARAHPELVTPAVWATWARGVSDALRWCHGRGVLHADVKGQNVLIAANLTPRLSDFGNSLFLPPPSSPSHLLPTDPHGLGTPSYAPPEFVRPLPSPFSFPADVFSLGVTFGTWITAREPYEGLRAVERMVLVKQGAWYEWEERRRVAEEVEMGSSEAHFDLSSEGGAEGGSKAVSRQGSLRSVRSGRSSLRRPGSSSALARREPSTESVRSWTSAGELVSPAPSYPFEVVARSLLVSGEEGEEDEAEEEALARALEKAKPALPTPPSPALSSAASSTDYGIDLDAPSVAYYPGTSTPVQYFLSAPLSSAEDQTVQAHVVPPAVRELIRRMALPDERERVGIEEVWRELGRILTEERWALEV